VVEHEVHQHEIWNFSLHSKAGTRWNVSLRSGPNVCRTFVSQHPYSLALDFLVDNACVHHRPRHWLYHWHGFPRPATERSPSLRQELGTVCHQKWRLYSVCDNSRLNSRLVCFPPKLTVMRLRCHWQVSL